MKSRRLFLAAITAAFIGLTGCSFRTSSDEWGSAGSKPKVLVSFPGLYSFAAAVGGDDIVLKSLTTNRGIHFHGEVTDREIQLARGCDVFLANGLGLDDYVVKKLEKPAGNKKWNAVFLGKAINEDWLHEGECNHAHNPGEKHDHGFDPHVWLGIRHAKKMVEAIREEFKKLDPAHAANFDRRAAEYLKKLDTLEEDGKKLFADKSEKKFVTFHDSLQYFSESYGIKVGAVIETKEGVEPTTDDINEIVRICQKQKIRVIAVEPQFPRTTSARVIRETLQKSKDNPVDAQFAAVDPLETADEVELSPDLYERVMRENLANLASVLK
ncbi:metal ABC transporter substrate-binding protein [Zavarzinella formosa]|uniref:metal ABC transporter substrate-binding protein n=1 Tax=Zavarzinella formosa TaxID=360055 RepID=UPI0002FEDC5D|nr:metal ABC transporter substrate-binding protein [Zavarzinella formosa]